MDNYSIKLNKLTVGYSGRVVAENINLSTRRGEIVALIGPNGSGKSTLLKTVTGQIKSLGGSIQICGSDLGTMNERDRAKLISLVTTTRIRPQLMTCREVVAMGRYPYTGRLGILSAEDDKAVCAALALTDSLDIAERDFEKISDGQRQRVMIARAICQDTDIIALDEPTSFLDLKCKLSILRILRTLAREKNRTVIMSLHELDLVKAIADQIVCLDSNGRSVVGTSDDIFAGRLIQECFGLNEGEFDPVSARLNPIF